MRKENAASHSPDQRTPVLKVGDRIPFLGTRPLAATLVLLAAACGSDSSEPVAIRLVDQFRPELVSGAPTRVNAPQHVAWNFGEPSREGNAASSAAANLGWKAGHGISGMRVRDGRLVGRTTNNSPILYVEQENPGDGRDLLHSIELRLRVDKGTNLGLAGGRSDQGVQGLIERQQSRDWPMSSPVVAGNEMQTITVRPQRSVVMSGVHKVLLQPTDVAGAEFEIESIRVISQGEHLARVPSGIGWHGLSEIYRETLVSRSPEVVTIDVDLAQHPWLDLNVGTVEDGPVRFRLTASEPGSGSEGDLLLERTVTVPHRWEPVPVDLSSYAGQTVALTFSLDMEQEGSIGFWGSPVIRNRGGTPAASQSPDSMAAKLGSGKPPRGVIVMMADTLRKDHLDFYGHERETSPQLSKLASQGVTFLDNVSPATWTKASAPSMMTSLYPLTHRVRKSSDRLPAAAKTLAEVYRDAGYATVSFASNAFTGKYTNLHQGYEELHERGSIDDQGYRSKTARGYADQLGVWLEAHPDTPFFIFFHAFDPHDPYEPYRPYDTLWGDPAGKESHDAEKEKARPLIESADIRRMGKVTERSLVKAGVDAEAFSKFDQDWYDGSIRGMDAEFGRVLERLRSLGMEDTTLVAFISDHGEEFFDHGRTFHGSGVYSELTNVPLVLRYPSVIPAGVSVSETVSSTDLMPTLLELSHLAGPEGMAGQSLVPLMAGAAGARAGADADEGNGDQAEFGIVHAAQSAEGWTSQPAFSERATFHPPEGEEAYSIVKDGWKLIHNTQGYTDRPEFELFETAEDPLDQTNVAEQRPDLVKQLTEELTAWRESAEEQALPEADSTEGLSDDELRRLRSLGYIQ